MENKERASKILAKLEAQLIDLDGKYLSALEHPETDHYSANKVLDLIEQVQRHIKALGKLA
jgi:hypothetical protein